jgi:predicted nucleic acid-binding protein
MTTVSNSGPILAFARAGKLDLLRELFKELTIPNAVYREIVIDGAGKRGSIEVETASWITTQKANTKLLPRKLD